MTTTVLGIYNAALSAVGGKGRLLTLSDKTREREECDIWYPLVRDQVQEAAYWPSSRRTSRLTLLNDRDTSLDWAPGDPESEYLYLYALPATCLRPWYLTNFDQFMLAYDSVSVKAALSTNALDAVLVYAASQTDPALWTPGQRSATIFALAASISYGVTNQRGLEQKNYQLANEQIIMARIAVANSPSYILESIPPPLAARGAEGISDSRFFYSYGPMFGEALPNA
jgi:hypothetical protein